MTHLPFIIPAYVLGVGVPLLLAITTWQRLRLARRRLLAIDPRVQ